MVYSNKDITSYLTLVRNIFFLFLARGVDSFVPFFILPILVNRLGIDNYGIIAMSMSLATYVGIFIQYGFTLSGTREIAKSNQQQINKIFSQYFIITHIVGFCIVILGLLILFFLDIKNLLKEIYCFSFLYILFYSLIPIWLFQGLEKFKHLLIINTFCKFLYICLIFFFIKDNKDLVYVNLFNFISILINYLLSLVCIFYLFNLKLKSIDIFSLIFILKRDIFIFLNQLFPNLYNNFSIFYLGLISGSIYAGLLQSAMIFVDGMISLFRIIINVIYPFLIKNRSEFAKISKFIILIILFLFIIYNIIIFFAIPKMFPKTFDSMLFYSKILGISIIFSCVYLFFGATYSLIDEKEKRITVMVIKVSIFSSILVLCLVPFYGIFSVLFVIILSRFLLGLFSLKYYFIDVKYTKGMLNG